MKGAADNGEGIVMLANYSYDRALMNKGVDSITAHLQIMQLYSYTYVYTDRQRQIE